MEENKAVGRWKVGDFFKHNKQNERKHEFKSGKVRRDLAKCGEQFGQQKRDNRGVGQKIIYRLVKQAGKQKFEQGYKQTNNNCNYSYLTVCA